MVVFISPNEGYLQENPKVRLHFSDVPIPDIQKRILGMQIRDSISDYQDRGEEDEASAVPVQGINDRTG